MMSSADSGLFIRRARPSDSTAVSRICLVTGDAGESAEPLLTIGEFVGICYAVPYLHVQHAGGFVLVRPFSSETADVDERLKDEDGNEVVAYVVFATDSNAFASEVEKEWYPAYREKYPIAHIMPGGEGHSSFTNLDKHYVILIHHPDPFDQSCLSFSPAHMHINILPPYQRQGWGRRLIGKAVSYLRDEEGLTGVWLGMDTRNHKAAKFYERIGFRNSNLVDGPAHCVGLKFEDWKD
ncbi:hypothetical protein SCHPADRAFT_904083 [Schizopora paradoxa]|uniref:N-acetyltransferase domain-containing protein n=1 Tax=Schizopora paradoxa TaxID=27342 RepID=A0A0H2RNR6_9AGAM|nr:hypothetical protein SCHPADRAFT_904083 [Schizopora paradoxa]